MKNDRDQDAPEAPFGDGEETVPVTFADTEKIGEKEQESGEDESEIITSVQEEEGAKNAIIYKDFSSEQMKVVNNTAFDIFFLEYGGASLTKYYEKSSKKPLVLILHTYTSDRYFDSEGEYGVCSVGRAISDELNAMGIGAIYSSAVHDGDMKEPHLNSRQTIEFYLKMYPSIKYVFDIGIAEEYEGESVIATDGGFMGERAAQIKMLVSGNNMTTGKNNLLLASEIYKNLNRSNVNLAREIVYDDSIKNSIFTPYYLELFVGSSGNSEEEGVLSARIFAKAFGEFLI
jgi:stage II sporulation protein P